MKQPIEIRLIIEDALDAALGSMIEKLDPTNEFDLGGQFGYAQDLMSNIRLELSQALALAIKQVESGLLDKLKRLDANGWADLTDGSMDRMTGIERIMTIDDAISSLASGKEVA